MPPYDLIEQQPAISPLRGGGVILGDEVNASDLARNRPSPQRNYPHKTTHWKDGQQQRTKSFNYTDISVEL